MIILLLCEVLTRVQNVAYPMQPLSDEEIAFAWHKEFWRSGFKLVYLLVSICSLRSFVVVDLLAQNRYLPFAVVGTGIYINWRRSSTPPFVMPPSVGSNSFDHELIDSPFGLGVSLPMSNP